MTQSNCDKKGVHRTSYYLYMPSVGAISNIYAWPAQQAAPAWQAATVIQSLSRGVTG